MTESFALDGMVLRPCYSGDVIGCKNEAGEFEACDDCSLRAKCPMQNE